MGFTHALVLTSERLEFQDLLSSRHGPVYANLWNNDVRRRAAAGRTQPLGRACGLHRDGAQRVLDATAGLGRDGIVLAALGCEVTLFERNPTVAALLEDGLRRASTEPGIGNWVAARVSLRRDDAIRVMRARRDDHDVVFLDPMYPESTKTALPKKELQALRAIAGDDPDAPALLHAALGYAGRRVVVKRPPAAEPLAGQAPDLQYKGKAARYDVYLTRRQRPGSSLSDSD